MSFIYKILIVYIFHINQKPTLPIPQLPLINVNNYFSLNKSVYNANFFHNLQIILLANLTICVKKNYNPISSVKFCNQSYMKFLVSFYFVLLSPIFILFFTSQLCFQHYPFDIFTFFSHLSLPFFQ